MNKKTIRFSAIIALLTTLAMAQQKNELSNQLNEVVVSDTKFEQSKEKSGKVITKISAEDLLKKVGQNVAQILSSVAGVEINGNQSAAGKNLGIYIRGGKNRQVVVLIDGIPVTDASGINLEYDLRLLPIEQVESIEIMKGASSTLYGSGAATGVINIILKKAFKKAIQANAYLNIGSNNTAANAKYNGQDFNQGFSMSGTSNKINYLATVNSSYTNGISQIAEPRVDSNYEKDKFSRLNYVVKLGFNPFKNIVFDFFGNYDKIKNDYDLIYDNTGNNDTKLNKSQLEQFRLGFSPKFNYTKGIFTLNSSFNKVQRKYDDFDSYSLSVGQSVYESRNVAIDGFNKYKFTYNFFLVTGLNFQFYDMQVQSQYDNLSKETTKFNIIDPYFTGVYSSKFGLNINAGARLNTHSQYGKQLVYNINPSFNFKNKNVPIKILASYSTAFITPSLYQLYSQYGNLELTPEKNATIEAGFEISAVNKKLNFNVVGFYREQNNTIDFYFDSVTFQSKYVNITGINKVNGFESEVSYSVNSKVKVNFNYTFTQVDEILDRLIRKKRLQKLLSKLLFGQSVCFCLKHHHENNCA